MKKINIKVVFDFKEIVSVWSTLADCFDGRIDVCSSNFSELMQKYWENAITCCIYCDEKIIGGCTFYANDYELEKAFISLLAIHEEYRGNGYASLLLKFIFNKARELGMKTISLEVFSQNTNAKKLYLKNGFKLISTKDEKLQMEKNLL